MYGYGYGYRSPSLGIDAMGGIFVTLFGDLDKYEFPSTSILKIFNITGNIH